MSIEYPNPIRLLCVDDDVSYVQLLCAALAVEIDIHAVGSVNSLNELQATVARLCPDVVLVDAEHAGYSTEEVVQRVVHDCPMSHVIIMSRNLSSSASGAAINLGARGYVHKSESASDVVDAVRRVMRNEIVVST